MLHLSHLEISVYRSPGSRNSLRLDGLLVRAAEDPERQGAHAQGRRGCNNDNNENKDIIIIIISSSCCCSSSSSSSSSRNDKELMLKAACKLSCFPF